MQASYEKRLQQIGADAMQDEYGITPEQYHAGLDKLWAALKLTGVQDEDVFTLAAHRIEQLEGQYENRN